MDMRRDQWLSICVLSGVLGICGCGGPPVNGAGEAVGETNAALVASHVRTHGLLRDGGGAGIAHARIDVRVAGSHRIIERTTTAGDGTFALDVRAGTYELTVTPKKGFAPQIFPGQVIAKGTQLELVIAIAKAQETVSLTGHVTDQNGQPLSVAVCGVPCVNTDDSGAFTVSTSAGDGLEISGDLSPAGRFNATFTINPTQSAPLVIVIPIFNLSGTVLDPTGAPIANVSMTSPTCGTVTSADLGGTFCVDGTQTDANGRFHFTSLPGDVSLEVVGDLGTFVTESVAGDTDVTIQVPPLQNLSGRITDRDGIGVSGSRLCLVRAACVARSCTQSCALSDGNGVYALDVSAGTYSARLFSPVSAAQVGSYDLIGTITLSQPTELDFAFPSVIVTGTVLNVDGTPASNVIVSGNCHNANISGFAGSICPAPTVSTDANGQFQLALATPGDLTLLARGATATLSSFRITGDIDVVIQLQPAQPTSGQVVTADGTPVAGATVCYFPTIFDTDDSCTVTDASGQYQLSLMAGSFTVLIDGTGPDFSFFDIQNENPVTLPTTPALVRLPAMRSVPLKVVNGDGSPAAGVSIFDDCVSVQNDGLSQALCGEGVTGDAAGTAAVAQLVGTPLSLLVGLVDVVKVAVGDKTELTIAVQSSPSP